MISTNILNNNLNNAVSYSEFFLALGYGITDRVFLRTFDDKNRSGSAINSEVALCNFSAIMPTLLQRNADGRGVFYVVNGGGQSDKDVETAKAQFIDFDDISFEDQIRKLNEFGLDPSIIIKTRKSLHCYWLLDDGEVEYFRPMQELLNQYFGSDPAIKNESRVMRLYGFNHHKAEPIMVTLLKFDPNLRYTQRQIYDLLPVESLKPVIRPEREKIQRGGLIPVGQRHNYVVSRIGEFLCRLNDCADDDVILAAIEEDFYLHCAETESVDMEDFREKYLRTIKKLRAQHDAEEQDPDFYSYAMQAWKDENPGQEFDRRVVSWNEVIAAGHRAKAREESSF